MENVAQIIDPPPVSPQVSQYIQLAVEQTEQSLGATSVALGDTRPDNTSAIIALQRAAATPSEMTKQNIHDCLEELFRIYLEFMAHYYGKRYVDGKPTTAEIEAVKFAQQMNPDLEIPESVPVLFDFGILKDHPLLLKLDVGASTYYSEIAAVQTLTNLLTGGFITIVDFLERVSDDYIPDRLGLLEAKRREMQMQKQALGLESPPPGPGSTGNAPQNTPDVTGGRGYGAIQRAINKTGEIPRNE